MGKIFKYPDGSVREVEEKTPKRKKNINKANLGSNFETEINESNEYYLSKQKAIIHKKPTPVQIVKVDYPSRNKAKIVEAYYKTLAKQNNMELEAFKQRYNDTQVVESLLMKKCAKFIIEKNIIE